MLEYSTGYEVSFRNCMPLISRKQFLCLNRVFSVPTIGKPGIFSFVYSKLNLRPNEACNSVADFKDGKYSIQLCLFHLLVQKYLDHAQFFLTVF